MTYSNFEFKINNNTMEQSDFEFLISLLPNYFITNSAPIGKPEEWRCRSNTGINNQSEWGRIFRAIKRRLSERFIEVYHTVNYNYTDFTIYLKEEK